MLQGSIGRLMSHDYTMCCCQMPGALVGEFPFMGVLRGSDVFIICFFFSGML